MKGEKMVITHKRLVRIASLALVIVLCFSVLAPIASAEGSAYITNYITSMTAGSGGKVTAWFQITGTGTMDEIGVTKVTIYENGTLIKTYLSTSTSGMMGNNTVVHAGSVTYSGTVGKSYYAHVTYKAGKDGGYDNRSVDTNTVTAKN